MQKTSADSLLEYATGGAGNQLLGYFNVAGQLPEMAQLLVELATTKRRQAD